MDEKGGCPHQSSRYLCQYGEDIIRYQKEAISNLIRGNYT